LIAIVDSGPLYAAIDRDEPDHQRCVAALEVPGLRRIIPTMVVAEVTYLVGRRVGPAVEASFLSALATLDVQAPSAEDWQRMAELVAQYADLRLGGTDASVIVLAERLNTDLVITLDRRHFAAARPRHCQAFRLLPE
jgi:predicted nucleic acid-binding protein